MIQSRALRNSLVLLALFLTMILGMVAKALYDLVLRNEAIVWGWSLLLRTDVFLPVIVSPMVFGIIYAHLQNSPRGLPTFIFAFQNGFFWKTIFAGLDKPSSYPQ